MLLVVGGHSRNIGKTSVVAGLVAALSDHDWTAVKITQTGHGVCSEAGTPCDCSVEYEHPFALSEETDIRSGADSARYLAAGARRAFWLRTPMGGLGDALPALRSLLDSSRHAILESNSILQFLKPDLYLVVMDYGTKDFKDSALRYLDRADAAIIVKGKSWRPVWRGVSPRLWEDKPRFVVRPPHYVTGEIADFVLSRMAESGGHKTTAPPGRGSVTEPRP
ncbi:MAG: hypothetical protein WD696_11705 [Bryobacteraceae bacterium]